MLATNLRNGSQLAPLLFYRVSTVTGLLQKTSKKVKLFSFTLLTSVLQSAKICNVKRLRKPTYEIN